MKRYRPYEPPEGPLERPDPLSTEEWLWMMTFVLMGLALIGALFG